MLFVFVFFLKYTGQFKFPSSLAIDWQIEEMAMQFRETFSNMILTPNQVSTHCVIQNLTQYNQSTNQLESYFLSNGSCDHINYAV